MSLYHLCTYHHECKGKIYLGQWFNPRTAPWTWQEHTVARVYGGGCPSSLRRQKQRRWDQGQDFAKDSVPMIFLQPTPEVQNLLKQHRQLETKHLKDEPVEYIFYANYNRSEGNLVLIQCSYTLRDCSRRNMGKLFYVYQSGKGPGFYGAQASVLLFIVEQGHL